MGPPELDCEWQDKGLEGVNRFVHRLWNYLTDKKTMQLQGKNENCAVTKRVHQFLKAFQERVAHFKLNTALAAFMEWLNDSSKTQMQLSHDSLEKILVTLSVFAPHMASELLERLLGKQLQDCTWPIYDPQLAQKEKVTIAIQVNGKTRGTITVEHNSSQETVKECARKAITKRLKNKQIIKVIFVFNRLINFVVEKTLT